MQSCSLSPSALGAPSGGLKVVLIDSKILTARLQPSEDRKFGPPKHREGGTAGPQDN